MKGYRGTKRTSPFLDYEQRAVPPEEIADGVLCRCLEFSRRWNPIHLPPYNDGL